MPVEHHDVDRRPAERARGAQAAEPGADDDDGGAARRLALGDARLLADNGSELSGNGYIGHARVAASAPAAR